MQTGQMTHGELTKRLIALVGQTMTHHEVETLIRLTNRGVLPELSATISNVLDANRLASVSGLAEAAQGKFRFGRKSLAELQGVRPELVAVANLAIQLTTQDFMIFDGLRTKEEQAVYVRRGTSRTMNSRHLAQADGFSHAIDCVPVQGVIPKWDWTLIYPVVLAVDQAATQLGHADNIVWGGAWDRRLSDFGGSEEAYARECEAYARRNPGKDFLDGPHFEWRA